MQDNQRLVLNSIIASVYPPPAFTGSQAELDSITDILISRGYVSYTTTSDGDPSGGFAATAAGIYAAANE